MIDAVTLRAGCAGYLSLLGHPLAFQGGFVKLSSNNPPAKFEKYQNTDG
jgi:hypothetical protein